MKHQILYLVIAFALGSWTLSSCGGGENDQGSSDTTHTTDDHAGHDHEDHAGHDHSGHDHGNTSSAGSESTVAHGNGSEYTLPYVCPMHCEGSGSKEEGDCPKCGMAYKKFSEHVQDGHSHRGN